MSGCIFNNFVVAKLSQRFNFYCGLVWAKIAKCSPDTALRDIQDLMGKGVLEKVTAVEGTSPKQIIYQQLVRNDAQIMVIFFDPINRQHSNENVFLGSGMCLEILHFCPELFGV